MQCGCDHLGQLRSAPEAQGQLGVSVSSRRQADPPAGWSVLALAAPECLDEGDHPGTQQAAFEKGLGQTGRRSMPSVR
jgi:hypothetical protein